MPSFRGELAYLSNFYSAPLFYEDIMWPTSEHAYVGMKTTGLERFAISKLATPAEAKRAGRKMRVRTDWDQVKLQIMYEIVNQKFRQNPELRQRLENETGLIVEENTWGDTFWGVCNGTGENHLGRILMRVRDELQQENTMPKVLNKRFNTESGVYIGRPSKWGNPFSHLPDTLAEHRVESREAAVNAYEKWVVTQPDLMNSLHELRGQNLICWCSPQSCHGDILLKLANSQTSIETELLQLTKQIHFGFNRWLNLHQAAFGVGQRHAKLPDGYPHLREALAGLLVEFQSTWHVNPNILYIQFLDVGPGVSRHRDPKSDLYGTTIGWYGDFEGGDLIIEYPEGHKTIKAHHGGRASLPCTHPTTGLQGPYHYTTPITRGRRWSLILNHNKKD